MTLFKQENMVEELSIDGENDSVIVFRENDLSLHLPSFNGEKELPRHIAIAATVAACIYNEDLEFHKLMQVKYKEHAMEYLSEHYGE